jgi:hypothetical protein
MMGLKTEWEAIEARIRSLAEAGQFLVMANAHVGASVDMYSIIDNDLLPNAARVYATLQEFFAVHGNSLPPKARLALESFFQTKSDFFDGIARSKATGREAMQAATALLLSLQGELSHLLADTEYRAHSLVERAFAHLRRSIVVDEILAARWRTAYETHETHCERLGAIHLLAHGLWGFKASAIGGATDLVLGEPLAADDMVEKSAVALVLTEWKRFTRKADLQDLIASARKQAEMYAGGVLGGVELRSYRYIVVVSEHDLPMPGDVLLRNVTYRHINIPVSPRVPSA